VQIDDLIVLGRGCPDRIKDGRVTVCTAGYSTKHGFVRIYPTRRDAPLNTWNVISVEVERADKDTREESWKIVGSKSEWEKLSEKIQVHGRFPAHKRIDLISSLVDDCVVSINEARRSLGIVRPVVRRYYIDRKGQFEKDIQTELFGGDVVLTKGNYAVQPRIAYSCGPKCRLREGHDQQVIEWGFFEWFRKNSENPDQVWDNARIVDPNYAKFLFVGNQWLHRTSFLVIEILRMRRRPVSPPLVPFHKIPPA